MRFFVLITTVALLALSCSSTDDTNVDASAPSSTTTAGPSSSVAPTATAPSTSTSTSTTTSASEPEATTTTEVDFAAVTEWNQVVHGEGCVCSDGSEFAFWEQAADPTKVVFFLQGGGACWTTETCDPIDGPYQKVLEDGPNNTGIFNRGMADNPFADYSYVYVPYCTGDAHLGNATTVYSDDLTVEHRGAVNAMSALDWMVSQYPDAADVFVTGLSAGSIPVPVYAVAAGERLPGAAIVGLGDASGAYPSSAEVFGEFAESWGIDESPILDAAFAEALTTDGFAGLFIEAANRNPDIDFGRIDYDSDFVQSFFITLAGLDSSSVLRASIDANETLIEAAGVELSDFVMAGTLHTILGGDTFYDGTAGGVELVEWVGALARGEQPPDAG
ncbi:MAG: hypothetical protein GXP35_07100 [Actinobacteria bacterium]|nr:hypothetical protein [Actinomycetota bacterium]